jgi:hypothetical protein
MKMDKQQQFTRGHKQFTHGHKPAEEELQETDIPEAEQSKLESRGNSTQLRIIRSIQILFFCQNSL